MAEQQNSANQSWFSRIWGRGKQSTEEPDETLGLAYEIVNSNPSGTTYPVEVAQDVGPIQDKGVPLGLQSTERGTPERPRGSPGSRDEGGDQREPPASPMQQVTSRLRVMSLDVGGHQHDTLESNHVLGVGDMEVSVVDATAAETSPTPPDEGSQRGHLSGEQEGLLSSSIRDRFSRHPEVLGDIEDQFRIILADGKHSAGEARERELQAGIAGVKREFEDTIVAMEEKLEARNKRNEEYWLKQLHSLREENSKVYGLYDRAVHEHKELITKTAQKHQEVTSLKDEMSQLKSDNDLIQMDLKARIWIDAEYPGGYSDTDLVSMPDAVIPAAARLLKLRNMMSANTRAGERRGVRSSQQKTTPQVAFEMPPQAQEKGQGPPPPRYTIAMGEGMGEKLTKRGDSVSPESTLGGSQPVYGDGKTPVSPISKECLNDDQVPGIGGGISQPAEETGAQTYFHKLTEMMAGLQKDQLNAFAQLEAELSHEIDRKINESRTSDVREKVDREQKAKVERVDECIKQYTQKHPPGPYASFLPKQQTEADGLMLAKAASGNIGYGGHYDLPPAQIHRTEQGGSDVPRNSTMMQSGYLPTRFNIPKHEEAAIGLLKGGEEARTKWPDFYANFEHLATSYGWGYEMKGALLNRRSRDHALQVINSLTEEKRMDYEHLVKAFNNAYIPSEWARAYRGTFNSRKQAVGETFLKYAAALRKLAVIAFPSTDPAHSDKVREQRCLDVFLNGIKDPHIAVFVTNKKPDTMEDAVSAAEMYSAIWARTEDLPVHPDDMPSLDTMQAAMVTPPAGNSKQPWTKPNGQKFFPKKIEGSSKKTSNGNKASYGSGNKNWENSQSEMMKVMKQLLEGMCKNSSPRGNTQSSQQFQKNQQFQKSPVGKSNLPAFKKNEDGSLQPRCYRCQKIGHIRRECRVNIGCVDECCVVEWYCEDHDPHRESGEDF